MSSGYRTMFTAAMFATWGFDTSMATAQQLGPELPEPTPEMRAAAFPDLGDGHEHAMLEDPFNWMVLLDRFEVHDAQDSPLVWEANAWFGRDDQKFWLRSEGARLAGDTEHAELELLWSKRLLTWWEFVAGVRKDFEPGPQREWAAIGIQGRSPYWFELEATAYLGEGGKAALSLEAEYDLLVTNRLIVQPRVTLGWYAGDDAARGIGSGLSELELGLRLRYEFRRELAPYVGLVRHRSFGRTAAFARAASLDTDDTRLVAGVRFWF